MRNTARLAALFAGLAAVAVGVTPAAAATARPDFPTCLISDSGHGHRFGHSVTCAELRNERWGEVGVGRFNPADHEVHHLTVTVQFQWHRHGPWVPIAHASGHGRGDLLAITPNTRAPHGAAVRACADVDNSPNPLCTP